MLNFFLLSPVKFDFQEWQEGQVVSQAHNHSHHTHRVTGFLSQKQHEENWNERGGLVDSNFNMIETMHHHRVHQFHSQANAGGMATIHHQRTTPCYNEMQQPGVVLPSMTINRESKTPYSDATQVRNLIY